jgi:sensor histidine kinase regulating citrate/malate metabolism
MGRTLRCSSWRIGVGLLFNRQLMTIARGNIELMQTGPDGSTFSIVLPS